MFERIDNSARESMKHMRCIVFLRPTPDNIQHLCNELKSPRYGNYHIFFSNIIPKPDILKLANADEHECVKEIQEFYADYIPLLDHVYNLNLKKVSAAGDIKFIFVKFQFCSDESSFLLLRFRGSRES